jgi:hypothetical protein
MLASSKIMYFITQNIQKQFISITIFTKNIYFNSI